MDFCVERRERAVSLVNRTCVAIEIELATAGKLGGNGERKFRIHRDVAGGHVYMVIGAAFLRIGGADDDFAVFQFQLFHGDVWSSVPGLSRTLSGRFG